VDGLKNTIIESFLVTVFFLVSQSFIFSISFFKSLMIWVILKSAKILGLKFHAQTSQQRGRILTFDIVPTGQFLLEKQGSVNAPLSHTFAKIVKHHDGGDHVASLYVNPMFLLLLIFGGNICESKFSGFEME
jgi:hypothetical protein